MFVNERVSRVKAIPVSVANMLKHAEEGMLTVLYVVSNVMISSVQKTVIEFFITIGEWKTRVGKWTSFAIMLT